ncbi:MAG: hypothetical protein JEY71_10290 [Sphaerochaeta sp.]|nr:hypothetical protein [Sphaerochaeta sp.]
MIFVIHIPKVLNTNTLKDKIGVGLFCLAVGEQPKAVETPDYAELACARINLSPDAEKYFLQLEPHYESRRALVRDALMIVQELPEHCRCKI